MPTALVTGASAGIGEIFARSLAARKFDLVIVARRAERLEALADSLRESEQVRCEVVAMDLAEPGAPQRLLELIHERGIAIDWLVNNAGFGLGGAFGQQDPDRLEQMVNLNVVAVTLLARGVLESMVARRSGVILNVGSVAGFQAVPHLAVYAATKAFVLHWTEALAEELKGTGVIASCLCPGSTATEFADVAKMSMSGAGPVTQSPEQVVNEALARLAQGRTLIVPGWHNQIMSAAGRLLPRRLATLAAGWSMQGRV